MKKVMHLVLSLSLVACATTANYEKILSSWVGSTEIELIRKWGPPQQSYETDGKKFITYVSSRNIYIPGTSPSYTTTYIGNTAYTNSVGGTSGYNIGKSCKTTFELHNDKITSWRWEGNDCKAM